MAYRIFGLFLGLVAFSKIVTADTDPFLWLEEVNSAQSLQWVATQNQNTFASLESDARYPQIKDDLKQIYFASDRIPTPSLRNGDVLNFWQDGTHVRGIWRKTSLQQYSLDQPQWETILDLDALATSENENWVWKEVDCLPAPETRCLISLSRGGGDKVVVREFDLDSKAFVQDGFLIPEAKSGFAWVNKDEVIVASDFGADSLTTAGYPRIAKIWVRGTDLSSSPTILEVPNTDVGLWPTRYSSGNQSRVVLIESITFYTSNYYEYTTGEQLTQHKFPLDSEIRGLADGRFVIFLASDWTVGSQNYAQGSVLSVNADALNLNLDIGDDGRNTIESVYQPTANSALDTVSIGQGSIFLSILEDVEGKLLQAKSPSLNQSIWSISEASLPANGTITVIDSDEQSGDLIVQYEDFLTPQTLILVKESDLSSAELKKLPAKFDSSDLHVDKHFAVSTDGTQIPYFVVSKNNIQLDGSNPTLMYGYGGFMISSVPRYSAGLGKAWLEKGGVYVLANIRGGAEYGPRWHQAALLENRQKAYDDFISIAEDLIQRQITSPQHLGIKGGSNGGLLVGAVMTQRPDLFNAVDCGVPLLDMMRYHLLLAGSSWVGEYGNPEDPVMAEVIAKYSPYQNLQPNHTYPKAFFTTSTADDRVHPGHARKMAAKMSSFGYGYLFYENTEGGHGGAANIEQRVRRDAMQYTYLFQQLF